MEQQGFNSMERPDLEAAAEEKSAEEQLKELAYKINEAESVADLGEVVYGSGDATKIDVYNKTRFEQLAGIDPKVMSQYEDIDEEGFLVKNGERAEHITAIDTIVADNAANFLEQLKEVVIKAEDIEELEAAE